MPATGEDILYKYIDEQYTVRQAGPGLYEVKLNERTGYLGVNLEGTLHNPFSWTTERHNTSPEGIKNGQECNSYLKFALDHLCGHLQKEQEKQKMREEFDPERTALQMREAMDRIARI